MDKLLAFAALAALPAAVSAATLSEGLAAYEQNRVADAERIFALVAADATAETADRSRAARELARITWLIGGKADPALAHLQLSTRLGDAPCDTGALLLRILSESGRNAEALERATPALRACKDESKWDALHLRIIDAAVDLAVERPAQRVQLLATAAAHITELSEDAGIEGARVRLKAAVVSGNSEQAIAAWKDYFWLTDRAAPPALERYDAARILSRGVPSNAAVADRVALAALLMRAGFLDETRRVAATIRTSDAAGLPEWRLVAAYLEARGQLDPAILSINRGLARNGRSSAYRDRVMHQLDEAVVRALSGLLVAAGSDVRMPRSTGGVPQSVADVLLEHYGLWGAGAGRTSDYPSVHYGHLVEHRRERVEQYGHSAEVQLFVIDNMLSNGFESWLWDGGPAAGGWAANGKITQVRPLYTGAPLSALELLDDSAERRKRLERQAKRAAEDVEKARRWPATLDGLNDRLQLQLVDRVAAAARAKGGDFRRAFLDEYWRASINQAITTHEGRHAINQSLAEDERALDNEELEYQAKLAELGLADYPRLALRNMNRSIGGQTPHDRAATRILTAFGQWIRGNPSLVIGYEADEPAEVQIDKLTDGQIRDIARGLDPLAKAATASGGNPS